MMLHLLLLASTAYGFLELSISQPLGGELLENCTTTEAKSIRMNYALLMTCGNNMGCNGEEDNNGRRRLEGEEGEYVYEKYSCFCSHCEAYFEKLEAACNTCNSVNFCSAYDEDGMCQEEEDDEDNQAEGNNFFQKYCVMDNRVVLSHGEDFCDMMSMTSETCLTEMEYMINPPPMEEEEDDNDNNGRRRLNDAEEQQVNPELLIACWGSLFQGGSSYMEHEWCNWVCTQYANSTYEYMANEIPAQTCGMQVDFLEDDAIAYEYLPEPVQHQSVMCVSSACTEEDVGYIANYLMGMVRYAVFVDVSGEEDGDNNNNNNNNNQDQGEMKQLKVVNRIAETRGAWRCDGNGAEGKIKNENFPDNECSDNGGDDNSGGGSKWATAATFAIICGLGMAVFMCLFLYYYRQTVALKTGQTRPLVTGQGTSQPPAASGVSYQEVRPHV